MIFDYCVSVRHDPQPLDRERFEQLINDSHLVELCKAIAHGDLSLKKQLPAVCWQASYGGGKRANTNAIPSGLFALDIDHINDPDALFVKVEPRIQELGIDVVHKTPSTHGMRIVARCRPGFSSISENQAWLAHEIGVEHDACTRDMARLSFLVPRSYFYYFNPAVFSDSPSCLIENNDAVCTPVKVPTVPPSRPEEHDERKPEEHEEPLCFKGVEYSKIVERLVEESGGEPCQGERNNRLYLICRLLSNITDRQPDLLFKVCPKFGLSEQEVRAVCDSACKSARTERLPCMLYNVLREFGIVWRSGSYIMNSDPDGSMPAPSPIVLPDESHLPPLIREFVATAPSDFKPATIMVSLAVCGFLGSRMRATYLDGEKQAPSFIVNVIAPPASGKGSLLRIPDICLNKVRMKDEEGRALEAEYQRQCQLNKNAKKQAEEPRPIVRDIPAKVSVAQLIKRMVQANGLHLISISAEADTLTNTNKSGAWAQKSDIYRIAQDGEGGLYGQDYRSEASFSATCRMRYNLVTLGTPGTMARAYPNVEDGLITRCIMVDLPSQFGKPMPKRIEFTLRQKKIVEKKIESLMDICQDVEGNVKPEHNMKLEWLNKGIEKWIEKQRLQAIRDDDHARDQFMRRSALIGFRAGMVAAFLWGNTNASRRAYTIEFALWVSNFILNSLINRYSNKVNEQAMDYETPKTKRYPTLFEAMGDAFTIDNLRKAASAQSVHSPLKTIVHRWTENNIIEKQGDVFVKLAK